MAAVTKDAHGPRASAGGNPDAEWEVGGVVFKDILPNGPDERRRRRRLYVLRAMDRLGLLGEDNLISMLARRPQLRWLADEQGVRWAVLAELGRVGEPKAFEKAVAWALEARPRPDEVRVYVLGSGSRAPRDYGDGAGPDARGTVAPQALPRVPRLRRTARKEERWR